MDAGQPLRRLAGHRIGDAGAHVAPLGNIARVAETAHELGPALAVRARSQPTSSGSPEKPYPGREGSTRSNASSASPPCAVGSFERADGLEQLDDRAGPAVGHDQRQRVLVSRLDVDEVDLDPVDLGRELRERVSFASALRQS